MLPDEVERHRFECECREWCRRTNGDPAKVRQPEQDLKAKRGPEGAKRVIQGMREQWARRAEWLTQKK